MLLHGFSVGGGIAALYLAQPRAPPCGLTSERSFRSFSHAAFAVVKGRDPAAGAPRAAEAGGESGVPSLSRCSAWYAHLVG